MDLQQLLFLFRDDTRTQELLQHIQSPQARVLLQGTIGSTVNFISSAVFLQSNFSQLIIANNADEAQYIQNDLQNLLEKKEILFLPSSYKKTGEFSAQNNHNILLRAQTINALLNAKKGGEIIVTFPEALQELLVQKEKLIENTLFLKTGEKINVDFMLDLLIEYGFNRTDFVYEPGEFSIRGGIVDVFSFGNELPYRIELFDDEVESLRIFDPETQLSERKISELTIIPNINAHFIKETVATLFDFLPKETIIWFRDIAFFQELIEKQYNKAVAEFDFLQSKKIKEHSFLEKTIEQLFITPSNLIHELSNFRIVTLKNEANKLFGFDSNNINEIIYHQNPQPSFNRNFDLLIQDLQQHQKNHFNTFIFAENTRQIERFQHIFEDKKANLKFHPCYVDLAQGFIDKDLQIVCYTDHQIFDRYHKYKTNVGYNRNKAITIRQLKDLNPGDYVTHIDHGVGKFSGLEKITINGQSQEMVRLIYKDNDLLYVNINSLHKISKYTGKEGHEPKINKLGSDAWTNLKNKTKKKIKDIAAELIKLYAQRKVAKGFAFNNDTYLQDELEASFMYEDTPDQTKATIDVKADMEKPHPMDRLICGDVGFGKTEIAIRAAFKAVTDRKQVAILVPTTILAWQHFKTFSNRLKEFGVAVDFLNRFKSAKEKRETLEKTKEGKVDILIGTHALLNKELIFKDLGLLIIDEEQKFGVSAKEKLRHLSTGVDTLTLTATPIPRTLKFSMMGARDLSNIMTPPTNRIPITTEVQVFDVKNIKEIIEFEVFRGGQVYFVHNRVKDLIDMEVMLRRLIPDVTIKSAHGQLEGDQLEDIMLEFINGEFDVLLSTNIVESGLDIPNANTIIINNAHHFGLSDLHQLRGRVGRSNKKAFCYLLSPPKSTLTDEARKRLQTLEEFSDLGSGFQIALRDMDIRGAGNLLGGEQSGFIADIGFEMYHKILDEAIQELKYTDFKEVFKEQIEEQKQFVYDCTIDTDVEMLIPLEYVQNTEERLRLYTELDAIDNEKDLQKFAQKLEDRFGKLPKQINELFDGLRIRWIAKKIGFERIILKNGKLRCYFLDNPKSPYYDSPYFPKVMAHIQNAKKKCVMKQSGNSLILVYDNIKTMRETQAIFREVDEKVFG
ncbi:MAG: transcription-repair coupling factor [Bacteroidota bacterium]|jgi:transcription-repair coupling factor (superfamily II helicase)